MKNISYDVYETDDGDSTISSFVGFGEIFSDKTATSWIIIVLIAFSKRAAFLTCNLTYK